MEARLCWSGSRESNDTQSGVRCERTLTSYMCRRFASSYDGKNLSQLLSICAKDPILILNLVHHAPPFLTGHSPTFAAHMLQTLPSLPPDPPNSPCSLSPAGYHHSLLFLCNYCSICPASRSSYSLPSLYEPLETSASAALQACRTVCPQLMTSSPPS